MTYLARIFIAGALFVTPSSAFASFDGDNGAFWERHSPRVERPASRARASRDVPLRSFKFAGDNGAFFERRTRRYARDISQTRVSRVAGFFAEKRGVAFGNPGRLFNRADRNRDGVLNRSEQRRLKRLKMFRSMES